MTNPVVVVTGASKGIGLAVAESLLVKHNAKVVSLSRSRTPALESLHKKHTSSLDVVQCDITDEAATASAIAAAHEKYGRVDALVLNAADIAFGRIDSPGSTVEVWKKVFDVNFFSLLHTVRAALPQLRASKGKIVFVSSGAATGGIAGWGAYNTSKAAMNSFCRTLASEEPDITCVSLGPGIVATSMQERLRNEGGPHMEERTHAFFVDAHATGKLGKPEDSGGIIAALAIKATSDLSGKFVSFDDKELASYRE